MATAKFSTLDRWGEETYLRLGVQPGYTNPQIQAITTALNAVLIGSDVRSVIETETVVDAGSQAPAGDDDADTLTAWSVIFYGAAGIEQHIIGTADWSLLEPLRFDLDLTTGPGATLKAALLAVFRFPDGSQADGILDDRIWALNLHTDTFLDREVQPVRPVISATMYKTASGQTLTNNVQTKIVWEAVDSDPEGMADLANEQMTIPRAGRYIITGSIVWAANPNGLRYLVIVKNGSNLTNVTMVTPAVSVFVQEIGISVYLDEGDVLQLHCLQTSGGNLLIPYNPAQPYANSFGVIGF